MNRLLDVVIILLPAITFLAVRAYIVWFKYDWLRRLANTGDPLLRTFRRAILMGVDVDRHQTYLRISSIFSVASLIALAIVMVAAGVARMP